MDKKYTQINFKPATSIEDAVNILLKYKKKGLLVCGEFSGTILYSDTVTMDDAYLTIVGESKAAFDESLKKDASRRKKYGQEHKKKLPELILSYQKKGRKILDKVYWKHWDEVIPASLNNVYKGLDLDYSLKIIKMLNNNATVKEASKELHNQNHSGSSEVAVCLLIKELCTRGAEFTLHVGR